MHTKHEVKEEGVITMCLTNGLFVLGKLIGGNKLCDPRIFGIIENGQKIQMAPLPGTPPFLNLGNEVSRYTMPEVADNKNILDLYYRVTHPTPEIILPDKMAKLN